MEVQSHVALVFSVIASVLDTNISRVLVVVLFVLSYFSILMCFAVSKTYYTSSARAVHGFGTPSRTLQ